MEGCQVARVGRKRLSQVGGLSVMALADYFEMVINASGLQPYQFDKWDGVGFLRMESRWR